MQAAQSLPFLAVAYPALHMHLLLIANAIPAITARRSIVNVQREAVARDIIPSAHWVKVGKQGVQASPKRPGRHDPKEMMKPGAQVHVR